MIEKIAYLIGKPAIWPALFAWPKFSLSSYRILSALKRQGIKPKMIIDVGANVGQFAVAASKLFPGVIVHAFEPNPDCIMTFQKNISSLPNVTVYPFALGDRLGEDVFNVNLYSHSSSILPLAENHRRAFPDAIQVDAIHVAVSTLDNEFKGACLMSPVLLKLDVQGYESRVLLGAGGVLKKIDYVILETSFKRMYEGEVLFMDIVRLMEEFSFSFICPLAILRDPETEEIIQMDVLFQRHDARSGLRP
jgi:FkbM family methyltransferase